MEYLRRQPLNTPMTAPEHAHANKTDAELLPEIMTSTISKLAQVVQMNSNARARRGFPKARLSVFMCSCKASPGIAQPAIMSIGDWVNAPVSAVRPPHIPDTAITGCDDSRCRRMSKGSPKTLSVTRARHKPMVRTYRENATAKTPNCPTVPFLAIAMANSKFPMLEIPLVPTATSGLPTTLFLIDVRSTCANHYHLSPNGPFC
jgi:hypothetical protein